MKKLSQWAKENGVNYNTAYNWYRNGKLPVVAKKNPGGTICVVEADKAPNQMLEIKPAMVSFSDKNVMIATDSRRNAASTIIRTDRYKNIEDSLTPFGMTGYGDGETNVDIKDAVVLCQKAYYNFAAFRNVIDLMTEFAVAEIYFRGGSDKSREFFKALFNKIGLWDLQDRFYREFFRSGNVFIYRLDSLIQPADVVKLTQVYGATVGELRLPIQYIILNPADIEVAGSVAYLSSNYAKVLNTYEVNRLKNPVTDEDKELYDALAPETKAELRKKNVESISIPLDPNKLSTAFYKKQDYEPLAIPLGYPVLEDLNWKAELKKMDMAISRTVQQAILLITIGSELKDGTLNINQTQINAVKELFLNESVGRVLVSDFTTKAEFVIPQIADILDPKKYQVVNEDIRVGLNNILVGDDKFANQQIKVQVFIERLKHARYAFKHQFLMPEIKRIAKMFGFKNFPTPYFSGFSLEDRVQWSKVYTRLGEIGILTAEEVINAIEDGRLPEGEESLVSQEEYKKNKDKGLYQPLIGGAKLSETGRPAGSTGTPQSTKKMTPIGGSENYSLKKVTDILKKVSQLRGKIVNFVKAKHNLTELNDAQNSVVDSLTELIISNEKIDNWNTSIEKYIQDPINNDKSEILKSVEELSLYHQTSMYLASILYHSNG